MKRQFSDALPKLAVWVLLLFTALTARSQVIAESPCIGVCKNEVVGILAGIAGGSAAIGIGVYFAFHHGHSITGCTVAGANGIQLQSQGDQQTYALIGVVAAVKPSDRIRVSGKKEKQKTSDPQQFLVERLTRDYGPCAAPQAR